VKDAQKPDHISLNTVVTRLKEGRYVIPDFQRDFEWKPWDISSLLRSLFLDYYIGSLLLWKGKPENFSALACEPIYGHQGGRNGAEHIVLDGQQRLTAMNYAFHAPKAPLPNRANRFLFFIRVDEFMNDNPDEAFTYDWTGGAAKLLTDEEAQFKKHMFPLAVIGRGGYSVYQWTDNYKKFWQEKALTAEGAGKLEAKNEAEKFASDADSFRDAIQSITEHYQLAYIELDRDLAVDKVCDIFTQINSKGIQLDIFDLINALIRPKGLQLKHLWKKAQPRLDFVESSKLNVYILQVMSIMLQNYCSPKYLYYLLPGQSKTIRQPDGERRKEILIQDVSQFKDKWHQAVDALEKSIKLLRHPQEFGAISSTYLPYVSILPAFAALQAHVAGLSAHKQLEAHRKVRHWYWASVFTSRYSGAVESTSARDYIDIRDWINDPVSEPPVILDFKKRFRNIELRKETKRGSSIYNGIFNLLVLRGARDWSTGSVPQHGDLDDHHIVPKAWGKTSQIGDAIDSILNRTPLSSETNRRVISDRLPNKYLPEMILESGQDQIRSILESHFISTRAQSILQRDPFTPEDFEAFIAERQRTIQDAIEDLLIKERIDLEPRLRELDEKVEQTEMALRKLIEGALGNETDQLPQHVGNKISERIHRALRKNASLDADYLSSMAGMLEYADLRELQDIILNKSLWQTFSTAFGNKESLIAKMDQLAELRNGIRHSRSISEITRKEGEASLLWFKEVLPE